MYTSSYGLKNFGEDSWRCSKTKWKDKKLKDLIEYHKAKISAISRVYKKMEISILYVDARGPIADKLHVEW